MQSSKQHWDSVYRERDHDQVGWYQANPTRSLNLIASCGVDAAAPVINIGGGSSELVDRLLDAGYSDLTVLDLSTTALSLARERLGARSDAVTWTEADVTLHEFDRSYELWHDRAVFHFLVDPADQVRYVDRLRGSVPVGGHVIIATFAPDGPEKCSGLPVQRYSDESMSQVLGADFRSVRFESEAHTTPSGFVQHFLYGHFRRL